MDTLPASFMVRLAQTPHAMRIFSAFSEQKQKDIVRKAHSITTKEGMDALISDMLHYNLQ